MKPEVISQLELYLLIAPDEGYKDMMMSLIKMLETLSDLYPEGVIITKTPDDQMIKFFERYFQHKE